jgi:hypothetical protein
MYFLLLPFSHLSWRFLRRLFRFLAFTGLAKCPFTGLAGFPQTSLLSVPCTLSDSLFALCAFFSLFIWGA